MAGGIPGFLILIKDTFYISGQGSSLYDLVCGELDPNNVNIPKIISNFRRLMAALCDLKTTFNRLSTKQKLCVTYVTNTILNSLTKMTLNNETEEYFYNGKSTDDIQRDGLQPINLNRRNEVDREIIDALNEQDIPILNSTDAFFKLLVNRIRYDPTGIITAYGNRYRKHYDDEYSDFTERNERRFLVCMNPYISNTEIDSDGNEYESSIFNYLTHNLDILKISLRDTYNTTVAETTDYDAWKAMKRKFIDDICPSYYYKKIIPDYSYQIRYTLIHNTFVLPQDTKYYLPTPEELNYLYPFIPRKYELIFYKFLQNVLYVNKPIKISVTNYYQRVKLLFQTIMGAFYNEKVNVLTGIVESLYRTEHMRTILFSNLILMFLELCLQYDFMIYAIDDTKFIPLSIISILEYTIKTTQTLHNEYAFSSESLMNYVFMSYLYAHKRITTRVEQDLRFLSRYDIYKNTIRRPYIVNGITTRFLYDINYIPISDVKIMDRPIGKIHYNNDENIRERNFASQVYTFDLNTIENKQTILDEELEYIKFVDLRDEIKRNILNFEDFPASVVLLIVDTEGYIETATPAARTLTQTRHSEVERIPATRAERAPTPVDEPVAAVPIRGRAPTPVDEPVAAAAGAGAGSPEENSFTDFLWKNTKNLFGFK